MNLHSLDCRFDEMTSWQNILDNLPTGTGRVTAQNEFNLKTPNNTNNEGDEKKICICRMLTRFSID